MSFEQILEPMNKDQEFHNKSKQRVKHIQWQFLNLKVVIVRKP